MIEKIGDRIAGKRKELNLTQKELADLLFVSDKLVSKWESNKCNPSIDIMPKLSKILKCSIDYLIIGEVSETQNIHIEFDNSISEEELRRLQKEFIRLMEYKTTAISFIMWIEPLKFLGIKENILYIFAPTTSCQKQIMRNYQKIILDCLKSLINDIKDFQILV